MRRSPFFGLAQAGHPSGQVHIAPGQAQQFTPAGAGLHGHQRQGVQARVLAGLAGLEQAGALSGVQVTHPTVVFWQPFDAATGVHPGFWRQALLDRPGEDGGDGHHVAVQGGGGFGFGTAFDPKNLVSQMIQADKHQGRLGRQLGAARVHQVRIDVL